MTTHTIPYQYEKRKSPECILNTILSIAMENRKILLRIRVFSFVYFLCVGIPFLEIVLSHAHKWDFLLETQEQVLNSRSNEP